MRAPDIYHHILERRSGKLARLGDVASVRMGILTGVNEFFYLKPERIAEFSIEPEYLPFVITAPQESRSIAVNPAKLSKRLFLCQKAKGDLQGTGALRYIEWGERQGFHTRSSTAARLRWYDLSHNPIASMALGCRVNTTSRTLLATGGLYFDKAFYLVESRATQNLTLCALLNSTLTQLFINVEGRTNFGGGVLEIAVSETRNLRIVKPELLRELDAMIFESAEWDLLTPSAARREVDEAVFDALGLTSGERDAVVAGAVRLVEDRLRRAGSV